jgi:hypothetical protein
LPDWEQALLQEDDDLAAQLEGSVIDQGNLTMTPISVGGKKRKNKKITLMTTTARRGA